MATLSYPPLWMRIMFKIAGKMGYIIVLSRDTPDHKMLFTVYKPQK